MAYIFYRQQKDFMIEKVHQIKFHESGAVDDF